jgi:hypothetical protein
MAPFSITLTNEKNRLYDRFAVFMFIMNATAVITLFFFQNRTVIQHSSGAITLLFLSAALFVYLKPAWKTKRKTFFLSATAFTILFWLLSGYWWAALITLLLAALYLSAQRVPVVRVDNTNIIYPSFPQRSFVWTDLNNMILKDGLLTIDLKNNKLIQQTVDEKITTVNEQNFNEFCRQQLSNIAAR